MPHENEAISRIVTGVLVCLLAALVAAVLWQADIIQAQKANIRAMSQECYGIKFK